MIDEILIKANLSPDSIVLLEEALEPASFKKGDLLVREGQVCRHIYVVEKGILRIYYNDSKGRDISHWFSEENQIISVPRSFFNQSESRYYIEALEDIECLRISYDKLNALFKKSHEIDRFGRLLSIQLLLELNDKLVEIQFKSAKERYNTLINDHPNIFKRVSLGNIASYIGITQQSLSRIRTER